MNKIRRMWNWILGRRTVSYDGRIYTKKGYVYSSKRKSGKLEFPKPTYEEYYPEEKHGL